ncbi:hypothetical protein PISL3812_08770 [Talaromyces islandicus]|uniref:Glucuronyl hydrolase n=1 Tax=Talaromyces islandicus TaxID=28573 RepID=A0A0U1M862_TALIS|nr:hypothetical protein PISL3812_08770 [Talaromyces islandicus]
MTEHGSKRLKAGKKTTNGTNGIKYTHHISSEKVIKALYSESVMAKIWKVAAKALGTSNPPVLYPEYTGKDGTTYIYRTLDFWTSGFFPGSMYLLLERLSKYSHIPMPNEEVSGKRPHKLQLEYLCRWWTVNLHQTALKRDTHDLGFMIAPWAMKAWDLLHDTEAYSSLIVAAHSLASRFNATVQCIRSWDVCITNRYSFTNTSTDFLVIIDGMLNLDLLFWAAKETNNKMLYDIAIAHARTTRKTHVRSDNSTFHVINFDVDKGAVKEKFTNQGYSDDSCWARGQSWGILGFMQTFQWTGDSDFFDTARALADYYIAHLPGDGIPYWDFLAPVTKDSPRDTSSAMVAACGMLLIYKALRHTSEGDFYLHQAMKLVDATSAKFLNPPTMKFESIPSQTKFLVYPEGSSEEGNGFDTLSVGDSQGSKSYDTILDGATINNYEFAPRRWANHGLVYADYYFLLFGNMLLEMGLVDAQGYTSRHA